MSEGALSAPQTHFRHGGNEARSAGMMTRILAWLAIWLTHAGRSEDDGGHRTLIRALRQLAYMHRKEPEVAKGWLELARALAARSGAPRNVGLEFSSDVVGLPRWRRFGTHKGSTQVNSGRPLSGTRLVKE